jgi:hypothetical protein
MCIKPNKFSYPRVKKLNLYRGKLFFGGRQPNSKSISSIVSSDSVSSSSEARVYKRDIY